MSTQKRACPYPTIRFIAFEERPPSGHIFVPDPSLRGRYILTDRCVALVPCPQCRSIPGEPCKGKQGYHAGTHCARRFRASRWHKPPAQDVLELRYDWEKNP